MCGIAGIIGRADEARLRLMTQMLYHRGPDEGAIWIDDESRAGFGHRRLRIIDLSPAASQPMFSPDGRFTLTFNGEIFNYRELRKELEAKGFRFRSASDTEVLLYAYMQWGEAVTDKLEGQFAFAVWDGAEKRLFAARDHLGIKPFYYARFGDDLLFASEAKSILAVEPRAKEIDWEAFPSYLTFLWVSGQRTIFRRIKPLPPASTLTYCNGGLAIRRYWNPLEAKNADEYRTDSTASERASLLRSLLADATESQLMSDVPLGILLSGGLDSTILLQLMSEKAPHVNAFTATYSSDDRKGDVFQDDLPYARQAASAFHAELEEAVIEGDVLPDLQKAIWHVDEPLADPTIVTNLQVTRAAKRRLTVLLSGMGADEIFAGYPKYPAVILGELLHWVPSFVYGLGRAGVWLGRTTHLLSDGMARRMDLLTQHLPKPFVNRYLGLSGYVEPEGIAKLLQPGFGGYGAIGSVYEEHRSLIKHARNRTPLTRMLYADLLTYLPALNLQNMDKTSMANSVEIRVPFLDRRVVEAALAWPDEDKMQGGKRKALLRSAFSDRIPAEILDRKKTGYSPPVRRWMRTSLQESISDTFHSQSFRERGIYETTELLRLWEENQAGQKDHSLLLWAVFVFELWMRIFIDSTIPSPQEAPDSIPRIHYRG